MKIYEFYQENSFSDSLSITLSAKNKKQAIRLIRNHIINSFTSRKLAYISKVRYMKESVNQERESVYDFLEEYKDRPDILIDNTLEKQMNLKIWVDNEGGEYSIKDFDNDKYLYHMYGLKAAEKTYIWVFENEPYSLSRIKTKKSKIISERMIC